MKLHTGDTVLIISGKDKGKAGTIMRVMSSDGRVVVTGINMRTRHFKKTSQQAGRKIQYEASIAASNVMLVDPKTKKPTRIGYKVDDKGNKKRIAKLSGEVVVKGKAPKAAKTKAADPASQELRRAGQKQEEVKKVTKAEKEAEKADKSPKAHPFWKRMGFGAAAMEEAETPELPKSQKDQSIPSQEIHVRSAGRGS
ncbi:50S ribosomal protein L24 [Candidatus Peregrinibacteria bacterium]|nr:50S ribosomal protein L24 [Candidatus Peregrinibacteria bacterium]